MRLVFIGLSLSSSWGNGHATTYRALLRGLAARGHELLFLERDQPWYAGNRDLPEPDFCRLELYQSQPELTALAPEIAAADAVIIGSYVHQGPDVIDWVLSCRRRGLLCFYDIDTPVTLAKLATGGTEYLLPRNIPMFDVYLSFTGGPTLRLLEKTYGARRAAALYCSVDADRYRPTCIERRWDLGYLGTYSADRQPILEKLLVQPARLAPEKRFVVAGPQYPATIDWPANVERIEHVAPAEHPDFYSACTWTLNVTRHDMAQAGWSPSVRLFEASACGTPIISDAWAGIEDVLRPNQELVIVNDSNDVIVTLGKPEEWRDAIAAAGRNRTLEHHTAERRAAELEQILSTTQPRELADSSV